MTRSLRTLARCTWSGGPETKDPRLRRCGHGIAWIFSDGGLLNTLGGRSSILHGRNQSVARAELLAAVEALRLCKSATQQVFIWTDCMFVVNGFTRGRRKDAGLWGGFWKAHDATGPPVLFHKVWRSHATQAEIAAGLISPLEAYGNETADKLAARGALRNALSMEYVAATRNTDSRVRLVQTRLIEINLMHVQNRTKTVRVKAETSERRAKFDLAEAMSRLNKIGHDFSRVQVGKGRFTNKCRLCFLRGERAFLNRCANLLFGMSPPRARLCNNILGSNKNNFHPRVLRASCGWNASSMAPSSHRGKTPRTWGWSSSQLLFSRIQRINPLDLKHENITDCLRDTNLWNCNFRL